MEVGNMEDLNNMLVQDFNGIMRYLDEKNKKQNKGFIPLPDSSKEMIKRAREKKDAK